MYFTEAIFIMSTYFLMHMESLSMEECPMKCVCNVGTITCTSSSIPQLPGNLHSLHLVNTITPLTNLTQELTKNVTKLNNLLLENVGMETIDGNALSMIPRLEVLEITHNNIQSIHKEAFAGCNQLASIILENNNIQIIEENSFNRLESLQHLSLQGNHLKIMPSPLPPRLKQLDVRDNNILSTGNLHLAALQSLNICNNAIKRINSLEIELPQLTEFCLGNSGLQIPEDVITSSIFPKLETLKIQGQESNPTKILPSVVSGIHNMTTKTLKHLEIDHCSIPITTFSGLHGSKLQELVVTNTGIIATRSTKVRFAFPGLIIFNLSHSPILAQQFIAAPSSQYVLEDVRILSLANTTVTRFPRHLLEKLPSLSKLDISHNPLHCDCDGLSWLQEEVLCQRIKLLNEDNTVCATPDSQSNESLTTAVMCAMGEMNRAKTSGSSQQYPACTATQKTNLSSQEPNLWLTMAGSGCGVTLFLIVVLVVCIFYQKRKDSIPAMLRLHHENVHGYINETMASLDMQEINGSQEVNEDDQQNSNIPHCEPKVTKC